MLGGNQNSQAGNTALRYYSTASHIDPQKNYLDQIIWNKDSSKKNHEKSQYKIDITEVFKTQKLFSKNSTVQQSVIQKEQNLSKIYEADIYLKRQEVQRGRTYKIRGAYYYYLQLDQQTKKKGVVVASDGNFGCAVSIIAGFYKLKTIIFVPQICYQHKIDFMRQHGGEYIEIIQICKQFAECWGQAQQYAKKNQYVLLQPYTNEKLMIGYATIANQIIQQKKELNFDYILVPSGGGALVSSIASFFKQISPTTKIIAVEPDICKPFSTSILNGKIISSERVSDFCNGSSVKSIGQIPFLVGKTAVDGFIEVTQNKVALQMIKLYSSGIISQPSGALSVAGLSKIKNLIKGKKVLCLLSGANIDLGRFQEAREMNAKSKGYKNFYLINLPNKHNALYDTITRCFKKTDVITIQYSRNSNKNSSKALIAIESLTQDDVQQFITKMNEFGVQYENITQRDELINLFF